MVYFDIRNYNSGTGAFHVWMEWDAALNNRLNDRLPSGGYFIKATEKQALQLWEETEGLPVYMKLIAREGRIYPYRTYMMWKGRPFSVEFDGKALLPPEKKAGGSGVFGQKANGSCRRTGQPANIEVGQPGKPTRLFKS